METYYVYISKGFETPSWIANMFRLTERQLQIANPQWRRSLWINTRPGEEVNMPLYYENGLWFPLFKNKLIKKERQPTRPSYRTSWFPPEPSFGSPSSPLSTLLTKLGNPKYTVTSPGTRHSPIRFTDGWDSKNIGKVFVPQLKGIPFGFDPKKTCTGTISFYIKAHNAIKELFEEWEYAGLLDRILTYEGSFNPRVIGSGTNPSNHSFGTAFDINAKWNGEKQQPAGIGQKGCLLELVPIANRLGWYWGGFYKSNIDGMHFEYAKL